jgi:hypothetical protein
MSHPTWIAAERARSAAPYFRRRVRAALVFLVLTSMLPASPLAITADRLEEFKIVGAHFTTRIHTGSRRLSTTDADKGRYLVLQASALVEEDTHVFAPDFVLVYRLPDGREERAECDAIATAKVDEPGDIGTFAAGTAPRLRVRPGRLGLALAFFVEPGVKTVEIHRIGGPPSEYEIGTDRTYSVFLTTNAGTEVLGQAAAVIESGGYKITHRSTSLAAKEEDITIHFAEKAELPAREISQRLMTTLGIPPTVKKAELVGEVDVVVWLGKRSSQAARPKPSTPPAAPSPASRGTAASPSRGDPAAPSRQGIVEAQTTLESATVGPDGVIGLRSTGTHLEAGKDGGVSVLHSGKVLRLAADRIEIEYQKGAHAFTFDAATRFCAGGVRKSTWRSLVGVEVATVVTAVGSEVALEVHDRPMRFKLGGDTSFTPAPLKCDDDQGSPSEDLVREIQSLLVRLGFYRGPADGALGDLTKEAIRRYETKRGLPVTGEPSRELLDRLKAETKSP